MHSPKLRNHKATNRAFVEVKGRRFYLGKWDTPEAKERYHRLLADLAANGAPLPNTPQNQITVVEVMAAYWQFALGYYQHPGGTKKGQLTRIKPAIDSAAALYRSTPAIEFGPRALAIVRQSWVESDKYSRRTCNAMLSCLKRAFKWAAAQELIPGSVYTNLATVEGLKLGRTSARESEPVKPVPLEDAEATKPHVSRQVAAMIDLQLLTAARPGEVVLLRPCDITQDGEVWTATLQHHKNAYRGKQRTLYFGPRAQMILRPFLLREPEAYLFDPREATKERYAACENHRHQPVRKPATKRKIGERYDTGAYARAIARGVESANKERAEKGLPLVPHWSPNQLRHTAATAIRKEYGLEGAQVLLGHAQADVTQIYAEVDTAKAVEIVRRRG